MDDRTRWGYDNVRGGRGGGLLGLGLMPGLPSLADITSMIAERTRRFWG